MMKSEKLETLASRLGFKVKYADETDVLVEQRNRKPKEYNINPKNPGTVSGPTRSASKRPYS